MLSAFLLLSLCFSLSSTAFAQNLPILTVPTVVSSNEMVLSEQNGHIISILGEDLNNGDARFSMLRDGEVVSESYVDRSACEIIRTEFQNGVAVTYDTKSFEPPAQASVMAVSGYTAVGAVRYNHYVQGMIMCVNSINWSYSTSTNPASVCDLNGTYRDMANFAASICGIIGLFTASGALQVANMVLTILGITGSPGEIIIPQYIVSCTRTEVVWRAYNGSKEKFYQGYRCVVTHPNNQGQTVYEGDYYPITAISNHNADLALAPYTYFYPGSDMYEIASWPS